MLPSTSRTYFPLNPMGPSSPPQTPSVSPRSERQPSPKSRYEKTARSSPRPNVLGSYTTVSIDTGLHFTHTPSSSATAPELSPRTVSPSPHGQISEALIDEGSSDGPADGSTASSPMPNSLSSPGDDDGGGGDCGGDGGGGGGTFPGMQRLVTVTTWVVEELSDFDPMEDDVSGLELLRPYVIEDADSVRTRSQCSPRIDRKMMRHLRKLHVGGRPGESRDTSPAASDSALSSSDEDDLEAVREEYIRAQRERSKQKRRTFSMASAGSKRTLSELSGGESDDVDDSERTGMSSRRTRRRTDRWSIKLSDQPPPRIDEQEEPPETEDEVSDWLTTMKELPYCSLEIMEVDSS